MFEVGMPERHVPSMVPAPATRSTKHTSPPTRTFTWL